MAVKDYDTHEAYNGPLHNSTEKVFKKAQKAGEKDNWATYIAPYVPGAQEGGRVGAFYEGVDYMRRNQPDLSQLIRGTDTGNDAETD